MKNLFLKWMLPAVGLILMCLPALTALAHLPWWIALVFVPIAFIKLKKRNGSAGNIYCAGVVNQYGLDMAFKNARQGLLNAGVPPDEVGNAVLSQSYLRLEQLLTATSSNFNFPILVNSAGGTAVRPTEQRLNQQDAFFCSNIAFYLAKASSATATNFIFETFPNQTIFTTGLLSYYTLYNGFMQIIVNKQVVVPAYPMYNFCQTPQTQNSGQATPPADQFDPSQVSLWQPTINFIGTKQNQISIQLPGNLATVDATTYGVFVLQGVLAQNVTLMS